MRRSTIVIALTLAVAGCSNSVPQDGFKQFRYGMTAAELQTAGFKCPGDGYCSNATPDTKKSQDTLFGHPADVSPMVKQGRLVSVDVSTDLPATDIEAEVTKNFGKPHSYDYATPCDAADLARREWHVAFDAPIRC